MNGKSKNRTTSPARRFQTRREATSRAGLSANNQSDLATGLTIRGIKGREPMMPVFVERPDHVPPSPVDDEIEVESGPEQEISCEQAIQLMGIYLSHEMTFWQRHSFVRHLRACADCHAKLLVLEIALQLAAEQYAME